MSRKERRREARARKARGDLDHEELHRRLLEHHAALRLRQARAIYDRILGDDNPHALALFGDTALRYDEFAHAASLIDKSIDLGLASSSSYNALGLAQLQAGRLDEAEASLGAALERDEADYRVRINLGILRREQGRLDDATTAFAQATELEPNHANAHLHLAETRLRNKAPEDALESIEAALTIAPGSTRALSLQCVAFSELGQVARLRELVAFERLVRMVDARVPEGSRDLERFHRGLARHIARHPTLAKEPAGFSTRAGAQTLGNLLQDPAPVVRALEKMVDAAVESVLGSLPVPSDHPQVLRRPDHFRLEGWGVRLTQGGHQTSHIHRDGWWSAVYYVELGDVVEEGGGHAGWLELGRGPDALYPCGSEPETLLVRPRPGCFVIFPSYLWHRTIPFERKGARVSFAFDVIPA